MDGGWADFRHNGDLNFHLPTDLNTIVRRDQEQIHGVDRVAQHECE
jgi:hypothetical protein